MMMAASMPDVRPSTGVGGAASAVAAASAAVHRISLEHITFEPGYVSLGDGASGFVRPGTWSGVSVAVKFLYTNNGAPFQPNEVAAFENEAVLHYDIRHPNIVTVFGFVVDETTPRPTYAIVMERLSASVFARFIAPGAPRADMPTKLRVLRDLACGLAHLHSRSILHLDLKSKNALVTDAGQAKLADFGMSVVKAAASRTEPAKSRGPGVENPGGTPLWMAPELHGWSGAKREPSADVYSFGILMWEVLAQALPYPAAAEPLIEDEVSLAVQVRAGRRPPLDMLPAETPLPLRELVVRCWGAESVLRPTMAEVLAELDSVVSVHTRAPADASLSVVVTAASLRVSADDALSAEGAEIGSGSVCAAASPNPTTCDAEALGCGNAHSFGMPVPEPASAHASATTAHSGAEQLPSSLSTTPIPYISVRPAPDTAAFALPLEMVVQAALLGLFSDAAVDALARVAPRVASLRVLDLAGRNLRYTDGENLSKVVRCFPYLEELRLGYVSSPLHSAASRNINMLDATGTCAILRALPSVPQLLTLDLDGNDMGKDGALALATALPHLSRLRTLQLSANGICAAGARLLASALLHVPHLTTFSISNNRLSAAGATALTAAFSSVRSLRAFNVAQNSIGPRGASALAAALAHVPQLTSLEIGNNGIGADGAMALASALPRVPELAMLTVDNNAIADHGAQALAEALPRMTQLAKLDVSNNLLSIAGLRALANALHRVPHFTVLRVSDNRVGEEGGFVLAEALRHVPLLSELCVDGTDLGAQGTVALAGALHHVPALVTLRLGSNAAGHAGIDALTRALSGLPQLQSLDLHCNAIDEDAATALASALRGMTQLSALDMGFNPVGDVGTSALASAIAHLPLLTELNLPGTGMGAAGATALVEAMQHAITIQSLDVRANDLDPATVRTLRSTIPENCRLHANR